MRWPWSKAEPKAKKKEAPEPEPGPPEHVWVVVTRWANGGGYSTSVWDSEDMVKHDIDLAGRPYSSQVVCAVYKCRVEAVEKYGVTTPEAPELVLLRPNPTRVVREDREDWIPGEVYEMGREEPIDIKRGFETERGG